MLAQAICLRNGLKREGVVSYDPLSKFVDDVCIDGASSPGSETSNFPLPSRNALEKIQGSSP